MNASLKPDELGQSDWLDNIAAKELHVRAERIAAFVPIGQQRER